jgi:hypothetical protein
MFCELSKNPKYNICEDCYRNFHYRKDSLVKAYKHCILAEVIDPSASRKICCCSTVPHFDANGCSRTLFPVNKEDKHQNIDGPGSMQCGLLKLGEIVAEAKYDGMQTVTTKTMKRSGKGQLREPREQDAKAQKEEKEKKEKGPTRTADRQRRKVKILTQPSLQDSYQKILASGSTPAAAEEEADKDIPFLFRPYTEKYPFGNVHMALRIGPLIIENGVSQ